jgi:hypothetical protein
LADGDFLVYDGLGYGTLLATTSSDNTARLWA